MQHNNNLTQFHNNDSWVILSGIEQSIKRKIESVGTPLKDWDIQINYGIKTGFNDAFVISTVKRDEILENCATDEERVRTSEIIRPILRGRDIKRYSHEWANLWLVWIPWHFPLHLDPSIQGASQEAEKEFTKQYPAVYNHLLQYKNELSARNKAETGIRYEWYAMQRWGANYWEDFDKPKIVYPDIAQRLSFSFSSNKEFLSNTAYFFHSDDTLQLTYLLRVLNSKLIDWYYRNLSVQLGEKAVRMFSIYVLILPIPQVRYDDIIELTSEEEIDKYVYTLFGLSDVEIAFIETL